MDRAHETAGSSVLAPATPIAFDNSYARLPERFFVRITPPAVAAPELIRVNAALAAQLQIDANWLRSAAGISALAGNSLAAGSTPIATVYAGHQFGGWNPQLGDGRAILLGEVIDRDGERFDLQLKGSGPTPYSRGGDGRSPLGPVLREYVISEAMATFGVPTTRALAAVTTGQPVVRERLLPGAILTRVARSHLRIGTFEYFASREDEAALQTLVEHVLHRHYPEVAGDGQTDEGQRDSGQAALLLLEQVIARQAELIARWQLLGFVHGVMNTDNMLVSGETIDYGPCAFIDAFRNDAVFSSIDHAGRYAYGNQPRIALFNLACLAQALMPLIARAAAEDAPTEESSAAALTRAQQALDGFQPRFAAAFRRGLRAKVGLVEEREGDDALLGDLLALMERGGADFTLTFRYLTELAGGPATDEASVRELYELPPALAYWIERWRERISEESLAPVERQRAMAAVNPALIPRNHLVEEAIAAATEQGDFGPFHALVDALAEPFTYRSELAPFARPPRPEQLVTRTFCGT